MPVIKDWFVYTDGAQGQGETTNDSKFGNSQTTLKATLKDMAVEAWNASLGKGVDPCGKLSEYIQQDGRYAPYDPDKLAAETMNRVRQGGSRNIDLEASRRGGPRRYLAGRTGINHRSG